MKSFLLLVKMLFCSHLLKQQCSGQRLEKLTHQWQVGQFFWKFANYLLQNLRVFFFKSLKKLESFLASWLQWETLKYDQLSSENTNTKPRAVHQHNLPPASSVYSSL